MDPIIGGLITGGASLLGNIFSSNTNAANTQAQIMAQASNQLQAEQFNSDQSAINREFQANQVNQQELFQNQMSSTAYQRASADMKAAGLNPMMMFGSGGPASSPSGSAASGSTASVGTPTAMMPTRTSPLGNLGQVVTSGISSAMGVQDLQKRAFETDSAEANAQEDRAKARQAAADATIREREVAGKVGAADRAAREETNLAKISPDEQRAAIQSPYIGKAYGGWGSEIATPAKTVINGLTKTVGDMVDQVTGPTGQKVWQSARDAAANLPKYVGPGGSVLDFKDFPNIRKTTANPDFGSSYR